MSSPREEALRALAEMKIVYQEIGAIGVQWHRCKPGTKRFRELEKAHNRLSTQGFELSDKLSSILLLCVEKLQGRTSR